jgi:Epoxide hydrolase N terminus
MNAVAQYEQSDNGAVRALRVSVPEAQLSDMRRRIEATRWPDRETVSDESQGVQLATMQELARYWRTDYDWRKCEGKLNALPNFVTKIDGLDIHFIHVRSKHQNAMPLIVTHGWPGSVIELLKIIEPLTDPTAHGANAADAFHLVIPSLPGFGFSEKPIACGWGPERTARAWLVLMSGSDTRDSRRRAEIWVRESALRWPNWPRRICWASTPTFRAPFHSTSRRC